MDIDDFLKSPIRNAWLELEEPASLYLRKGNRVIAGEGVKTLDLATVEVQEEHQGKGVFKGLLKRLEEKVVSGDFDGLYVENILEPRLAFYLRKRGYTLVGNDELTPCLFKSKNALIMAAKPWADFYKYFSELESLTPEDIECCLSHEVGSVRGLAVSRKDLKLSQFQIDRILDDEDWSVTRNFITREDFVPSEEQVGKGLRSSNPKLRVEFIKRAKNIPIEIADLILDEGVWFERKELLMRPDFLPTPQQIEKVLNNSSYEAEMVCSIVIERWDEWQSKQDAINLKNAFSVEKEKIRKVL